MNEQGRQAVKIGGVCAIAVAVVFWLHSSGSSSHSEATAPESSANAVGGSSPGPKQVKGGSTVTAERYPNIESPDSVAAGQEFAVQVSLTGEQLSPETTIQGAEQRDGKVRVQMDAGAPSTEIEVILSASGMDFADGSGNSEMITLPKDADSSVALFHLRARPIAGEEKPAQILATLWHDHAFIGRIRRPIVVTSGHGAERRALPVAAVSETAAPIALDLTNVVAPADITIYENRVDNVIQLILVTKDYAPVPASILQSEAVHSFVTAHYAEMERHGRGVAMESDTARVADRQHAGDYALGFGSELYDKLAPAAFKTLFWRVMDAQRTPGAMLRIQILSDDPSIPWELMRPVRADGTGRRTFLGLESVVTRWHLTQQGRQRPPQTMSMKGLDAIAPQYEGEHSLPAVDEEIAALQQVRGYKLVKGDYADVRSLAEHLPQGIVHFAGHGGVSEKDGVAQFVILLQDGQIEPATWTALPGSGADVHPLFFFNACDVGAARRFMNGVDGWAPALLDAGASGYIGALWSVNDRVASRLSVHFYDLLGKSLAQGSADVPMILTQARAMTYRESSDATALAYVMYSDPSLRMVP